MKKNIKNFIQKNTLILAMVIGMAAIPASASAATVYVQASRTTLSVGDTAIVSIKIDADGAVLNSVAGSVGLKPSTTAGAVLSVQQFSLGNSAFGLWPRTPSLSQDGTSVSFVGGVPGGFSIEGATLFNMIVTATSTGSITITPEDMSVYANDGNGTKVPVQLKGLTITIVPHTAGVAPVNDWSSVLSTDTTPPEPFIIVLGQDPSLFNGQKFAFFSAVDNQSGIDHYEVSEDGAAYVESGSTYVLQNQTGNVTLNVIAYDKAGNSRLSSYGTSTPAQNATVTPPIFWTILAAVIVMALAVIGAVWLIVRKLRRKTNAPKNP